MATDHVVLCGRCKVKAEVLRDERGRERAQCPRCSNSASKREAIKVAGEYAEEKVAAQLDAMVSKALAGKSFVTYTPAVRSTKRYAWILDGL